VLDEEARLWASPQARDWKSGQVSEETTNKNSRPLNEQVCHSSLPDQETPTDGQPSSESIPTSRRQLNVLFVCWLQNFPLGWTDPDVPLASTNSAHWGIALWWLKARSHLSRLLDE
jgi:hypothetical protein